MPQAEPPTNLEELLDRFARAAEESDPVSLDRVMDEVGRRSFGPLLLMAGLITAAPGIGDIPGVPTLLGAFVLLVSVQLLMMRQRFWLPKWLLNRSISAKKLHKIAASKWLRRPAAWVDRLLRPRLAKLTGKAGARAIAVACVIMALAMPATEVVLFSANGVGAGLVAFGVSLTAHDGLLAVVGYVIAAITLGLALLALL